MVSKKDQMVYDQVLERDQVMTWDNHDFENPTFKLRSLQAWLASNPWVCVAPLVDSSLWGTCSGEMERDHIWPHAGGTKGDRAPTTMETLVILCHHHHQDGWATAHRPELREYIKTANERYKAR